MTHSTEATMPRHKFLFIAPYNHYAPGVRLLAAILRQHNFEADILIFKHFPVYGASPVSDVEWELLRKFVKAYAPNCIGVSLISDTMVNDTLLLRKLREYAPAALLLCGGFGPTFDPEYFLKAGADCLIRGEGESAILDLARALTEEKNWKYLDNIAYRENGLVIQRPLRQLRNLGENPHPLYDNEHISSINANVFTSGDPLLKEYGFYSINTSRGCFGHCTYCSGSNWLNIYKRQGYKIPRYRTRPLGAVMAELEIAKQKNVSAILFADEYFVRPHEEFITFFEQYKERINLPFMIQAQTEFLEKDERRFEALIQAGLEIIEIGVQSASREVVRDVYKRTLDTAHCLRMIKKFYERKVSVHVDFIFSPAFESEADYLRSLDFIKQLPFDPSWPGRLHIQAFNLGFFKGAALGEMYPYAKKTIIPDKTKRFIVTVPYIRHIIKDDDVFNSILYDKYFIENPQKLICVYDNEFYRQLHTYMDGVIERLNGKEVYFWGCGEIYKQSKHLFHFCKPQAVLVDIPTSETSIDGLRIIHPDTILPDGDPVPIIVFTRRGGIIANRIMRKYPQYADVVLCQNPVPERPMFLQ